MIIGLIPSRLNSKRLKGKALLKIDGLPLVIHTLRRAKLSKKLNDVYVCTDSDEIAETVSKYGGKFLITRSSHSNGTERIAEAARKFNLDNDKDLVIDIQGDEPLVNPNDIDKVINFHKKNTIFDIVVPSQVFKKPEADNTVKIVSSISGRILYMSRSVIPKNFINKPKFYLKHLSIISFKPSILQFYSKLKMTPLEKIEGIELLRALENDLKLGTFFTKTKSFSVDIMKDYLKAIKIISKDSIRKKY